MTSLLPALGCADVEGDPPWNVEAEPAAPSDDSIPKSSPNVYPIRGLTDQRQLWPGGPSVDFWSSGAARVAEHVLRGNEVPKSDLSVVWDVGWSMEGLRVRTTVRDDKIVRDSPWAWEDDSVEIYLDPDASAGETYDGRNDYQLVFRPNESKVHLGVRSVQKTDGIRMKTTLLGGDRYVIEVFVPWTLLGGRRALGQSIGLDVHVNDDDNGGDRDTKLGAYAWQDDAWTRPRSYAHRDLVRPVERPGSYALTVQVYDAVTSDSIDGARVTASLREGRADIGETATVRGEATIGGCLGDAPPVLTTYEVAGFWVDVEAPGFERYHAFWPASPTIGYCGFLNESIRLRPEPAP